MTLGWVALLGLIAGGTPALAASNNDPHNNNLGFFLKPDLTWRGPVAENGIVPGWQQGGHAARLPMAEDFIRLIPPVPLAHGWMFTAKPFDSDQWSVEVAFRMHGAAFGGVGEGEGHKPKRDPGKGGRGLAFWYTKNHSPSGMRIPAAPTRFSPPAVPPQSPDENDPTDRKVSFFGAETPFEGLGIVFDTAPSTPVNPRSAREHWGLMEAGSGADSVGVVSGILDDGSSQFWLEGRKRSSMKGDDEAGYLSHTIGDCEAAFRNAPGLVWAKISHFGGNITVDLDLSPHTSLGVSNRHYNNRCFAAQGVKLPAGYHFGITALGSANEESDSVDIYAVEVREVVVDQAKADALSRKSADLEARLLKDAGHKLQGTTNDGEVTLSHEIFASQARMMVAINNLATRVENLAKGGGTSTQASGGSTMYDLEQKVDSLMAKLENRASAGVPRDALLPRIESLVDRVNDLDRKLTMAQSTLAQLITTSTTRNSEILNTAVRHLENTAKTAAGNSFISLSGLWQGTKGFFLVFAVLRLALGGLRMWNNRKGAYNGDEGSYANRHGRGTSVSMAVENLASGMGFRQRGGKKVI